MGRQMAPFFKKLVDKEKHCSKVKAVAVMIKYNRDKSNLALMKFFNAVSQFRSCSNNKSPFMHDA
jgi:hypothetical protein